MGQLLTQFSKILQWSYKNDFVEPFPEIVLLLNVVLIASNNFLSVGGTTSLFVSLTWKSILILVIFVGIGGSRSYSLATERGETARQMLTLRISRLKFLFLKWLSLLVIFFVVLLTVDVVGFFEYLGYFPSIYAYSDWATAPTLAFVLIVVEQLLLLAFLNSFVMFISLATRRTALALLIFFAFALFSATPFSFIPTGIPDFLQLGYGDYLMANQLSNYFYDLLYRPSVVAAAAAPALQVYFALLYRIIGGFVFFVLSLELFKGVDMD